MLYWSQSILNNRWVIRMGLLELFEIGFFTALWDISNPYVSIPIYLCVLIGFSIQSFLLKKCQTRRMQLSLFILSILGLVVSEYVWHCITGWDRIVVDIVYGLILCLLLGEFFAVIAHKFSKH